MKYSLEKFGMVLFGLLFAAAAVAEQKEEGQYLVKEKWDLVKIHAMVKDVDLEKRAVTLVGPEGELVTVTAGDKVNRLKEVKVGDLVAAEFWTYMMAEFRGPTAEEKAVPLVVLSEAGKAPADMPPGAEVGSIVKAVVSIEIVNRPAMEVTVKGPRGNYVTVPVEDKEMITQLNVGQVAVVTYAEATALSLVKVK